MPYRTPHRPALRAGRSPGRPASPPAGLAGSLLSALLLALLALAAALPVDAAVHAGDCPTGSTHVAFTGHIPFTRAQALELEGCLFSPAGSGPFPAVVVLHGSGGLWSPSDDVKDQYETWAEELRDEGYVTLLLDSFSGRGVGRDYQEVPPPGDADFAPVYERSADAYDALDYLQTLPQVDDDRIAVLGVSHGGGGVVGALVDGQAAIDALSPSTAVDFEVIASGSCSAGCEVPEPTVPTATRRFACGVAYSTGASFYQYFGRATQPEDGFYRPYNPLLLIYGERDGYLGGNHPPNLVTKAELHGASRAAGNPVELAIYPGVDHRFDDPNYDDPDVDDSHQATQRSRARQQAREHLALCFRDELDLEVYGGPWITHLTATSARVHWLATGGDPIALGSRVYYGTDPANLQSSSLLAKTVGEISITLRDLAPGTRYYYTVGTDRRLLLSTSPSRSFVTPPAPGGGSRARFWVTGDTGGVDSEGDKVPLIRNAYLFATESYIPPQDRSSGAPEKRQTDAWIHLGDGAFGAASSPDPGDLYLERFQSRYGELLGQTPLLAAFGDEDSRLRFDRQLSSGEEHFEFWHSFDHGDIHVIVLDSTEDTGPGSPMMTWLAADLAASRDAGWLIAAFHHSPYSAGSAGSDADPSMVRMRQDVLPVLEAAGVDLVLGAHSRVYERSGLLDGHYGPSSSFDPAVHELDGSPGSPAAPYTKARTGLSPRSGAVYVTLGSSSVHGRGAGRLDHPAMVRSLDDFASLWIEVDGDQLDVEVYGDDDTDPEPLDAFRIVKDSAAALTGRVWADLDGDGLAEAGEPGLAGVTVRLLSAAGAVLGTTITGVDGGYAFTGLAAGDYRVEVVPTADYAAAGLGGDNAIDPLDGHRSALLTLGATGVTTGTDAAWVPDGFASVGDRVWFDEDGDGLQGSGEPGVGGLRVELLSPADEVLDATTTATGGGFRFDGVLPGSVRLRLIAPGWGFAGSTAGMPDLDSDLASSLGFVGESALFPLAAGAVDLSRDLGLAAAPVTTALVPFGSDWRHRTGVSGVGDWTSAAFDDSSWSLGRAPLGFPLEEVHETIPDAGVRSYLFRREFEVDDLSAIEGLYLQVYRDDGAAVYLNGVEVLRTNLPAGPVDLDTRPPESSRGFVGGALPVSALVPGTNVLAVSVHQRNLTSSSGSPDLGFDLALEAEVFEPCHLRVAWLDRVRTTTITAEGDDATTPQGAEVEAELDGGSAESTALLDWDLAALPAGAQIVHAELLVWVTNGSEGFYRIQPLERAWTESGATWADASELEAWQLPGAHHATDRSAVVLGLLTGDPATPETVIAHWNSDGRAVLAGWLDGSLPRRGIAMGRADLSDGLDFATEEAGRPPVLRVVYRLPASGTCP